MAGIGLLLCSPSGAAAEPAKLWTRARVGNQFQFTLMGTPTPGNRYVIEFSTNLLTWVPLFTNYEASLIRIISADAPGDMGFYRVAEIEPPHLEHFQFALTASESIYSRSRVSVDSFDSTNPLASTDGRYDASKARDRADVVCLNGWPGALVLSNAQIAGSLRTVPGALPWLGPRSAVGSKTWLLSGQTGVEPGHFVTNMDLSLRPVAAPFTNGAFTPSGGWITNVVNSTTNVAWYDYVLNEGNYQLSSLSGSVYVRGRAALLVTSNLLLSSLMIETDQSLDLYCAAYSPIIAGYHDRTDNRTAASFRFWGLPSCQRLTFEGFGDFTGAVYAPRADAIFSVGGNWSLEFSGALVSRSARFSGKVNIHFDESLAVIGPSF